MLQWVVVFALTFLCGEAGGSSQSPPTAPHAPFPRTLPAPRIGIRSCFGLRAEIEFFTDSRQDEQGNILLILVPRFVPNTIDFDLPMHLVPEEELFLNDSNNNTTAAACADAGDRANTMTTAHYPRRRHIGDFGRNVAYTYPIRYPHDEYVYLQMWLVADTQQGGGEIQSSILSNDPAFDGGIPNLLIDVIPANTSQPLYSSFISRDRPVGQSRGKGEGSGESATHTSEDRRSGSSNGATGTGTGTGTGEFRNDYYGGYWKSTFRTTSENAQREENRSYNASRPHTALFSSAAHALSRLAVPTNLTTAKPKSISVKSFSIFFSVMHFTQQSAMAGDWYQRKELQCKVNCAVLESVSTEGTSMTADDVSSYSSRIEKQVRKRRKEGWQAGKTRETDSKSGVEGEGRGAIVLTLDVIAVPVLSASRPETTQLAAEERTFEIGVAVSSLTSETPLEDTIGARVRKGDGAGTRRMRGEWVEGRTAAQSPAVPSAAELVLDAVELAISQQNEMRVEENTLDFAPNISFDRLETPNPVFCSVFHRDGQEFSAEGANTAKNVDKANWNGERVGSDVSSPYFDTFSYPVVDSAHWRILSTFSMGASPSSPVPPTVLCISLSPSPSFSDPLASDSTTAISFYTSTSSAPSNPFLTTRSFTTQKEGEPSIDTPAAAVAASAAGAVDSRPREHFYSYINRSAIVECQKHKKVLFMGDSHMRNPWFLVLRRLASTWRYNNYGVGIYKRREFVPRARDRLRGDFYDEDDDNDDDDDDGEENIDNNDNNNLINNNSDSGAVGTAVGSAESTGSGRDLSSEGRKARGTKTRTGEKRRGRGEGKGGRDDDRKDVRSRSLLRDNHRSTFDPHDKNAKNLKRLSSVKPLSTDIPFSRRLLADVPAAIGGGGGGGGARETARAKLEALRAQTQAQAPWATRSAMRSPRYSAAAAAASRAAAALLNNGTKVVRYKAGEMLRIIRRAQTRMETESEFFDVWVLNSGQWDLMDVSLDVYLRNVRVLFQEIQTFLSKRPPSSVRFVWMGTPTYSYKRHMTDGMERRTNPKILLAEKLIREACLFSPHGFRSRLSLTHTTTTFPSSPSSSSSLPFSACSADCSSGAQSSSSSSSSGSSSSSSSSSDSNRGYHRADGTNGSPFLGGPYNITFVPYAEISLPFSRHSCDSHHYYCKDNSPSSTVGFAQLGLLLQEICS